MSWLSKQENLLLHKTSCAHVWFIFSLLSNITFKRHICKKQITFTQQQANSLEWAVADDNRNEWMNK